jgi:hypothetical protein
MRLKIDNLYRMSLFILLTSALGFLLNLVPGENVHAENLPLAYKSGTLSGSETWAAGSVYIIGSGGVIVPDGAKLTVQAGAIIKIRSISGIKINTGGGISIEGTVSAPVIVTNLADDSAGGDSGADGPTTGLSQSPYHVAITSSSGSMVDVNYADIRYANYTNDGMCRSGVVTITNSLLSGGVWLNDCPAGSLILKGNNFSVSQVNPITAYSVDVAGIDLSGTDKNTFVGTNQEIVLRLTNASIAQGREWAVEGSSGAVIRTAGLIVQGSLQVGPGSIFKAPESTGLPIIVMKSGSNLDVAGVAESPATFTSIWDNSIGGNSNNNGGTNGTAGDYMGALGFEGASSAKIEHAKIKYANTGIFVTAGNISISNMDIDHVNNAINLTGGKTNLKDTSISNTTDGLIVGNGAQVSFRGSFDNISGRAIKACKWAQDCAVDAAYVDWGSADGPFVTNGNDLVCGQVAVSPWVHNSAAYDEQVFAVENCDGSSTPTVTLSNSISHFQQRIGTKQIDCGNGFQDACNAINTAMACLGGALSVAQSTAPWPLPPAGTAQQIAAFGGLAADSASTYITSQATVSVTGFSFALIGELTSLAGIFTAMGGAYGSCAP